MASQNQPQQQQKPWHPIPVSAGKAQRKQEFKSLAGNACKHRAKATKHHGDCRPKKSPHKTRYGKTHPAYRH